MPDGGLHGLTPAASSGRAPPRSPPASLGTGGKRRRAGRRVAGARRGGSSQPLIRMRGWFPDWPSSEIFGKAENAVIREEEFERLYASHAQRLFGFLAYRTGDRALAEDLVADTFERVMRGGRRFD